MKRIFGVKTILINGCKIYTYCLTFKHNAYNEQLFKDNNLPYQLTHKNKLLVSFTTSDPIIFSAKVQKLGKCCKAIALSNIADKYIWVIE